MTDRLSAATLDRLPADVQRPACKPGALRARMVHIGVGAFHKAHQAVFTEDANAAAGEDWGTVGVSLRTATASEQLTPQDGLYTVGARDGADQHLRVIGNITQVVTAPQTPQAAQDALAHPDVSMVTLTITEKGYGLDPATGDLMTDAGDIAADLRQPETPRSAVGYLTQALRRRRDAGTPAFTSLSCDNIPANGHRLQSAVLQYANLIDADLAGWIEDHATFPSSMVDRIAPATTPDDLHRVAASLGVRDAGYVKTEPFKQWVIEDKFAGPRPAWDAAGAMIAADVAPYETAKLRLLNGAHSAIAYLGALAGRTFVHDVMADPALAGFVTGLMDEEIAPTVTEPAGMPLGPYVSDLRARFSNSSLQHRTAQIAMDGSQKLPQRVLDPIRDRIKAGAPFDRLAVVVAAWMIYARGRSLSGDEIAVSDPLSSQTLAIGARVGDDLDAMLSEYLKLTAVFGHDLPSNPLFRQALGAGLRRLASTGGVREAAEASL